MPFAAARLYRWLGRHYLWLYVGFEVTTALIIAIATVGLFALYTHPDKHEFWRIVLVAEILVSLALVYTVAKAIKMAKPLSDWLRRRDPADALDAWLVAIEIPRRLVVVNGWQPFVIVVAAQRHLLHGRARPAALQRPDHLRRARCVAVAYAAVLHFFASELFLRPVVEDIAERLPPDFAGHARRRAAALEAARRAADHQHRDRGGGQRPVHRRHALAQGPRPRRGGGAARGLHDLARADAADHQVACVDPVDDLLDATERVKRRATSTRACPSSRATRWASSRAASTR